MQPTTSVTFDSKSFNRLKRTIKNMAVGKKQIKEKNTQGIAIPDEVGIQLTHKCNLRCKTCFQWNEEGFFHQYDSEVKNGEIPFELVENIFAATKDVGSNIYLWGGEPLSYSQWPKLAKLLEEDPRWTVFCTNGVSIDKHLESLVRISENLALLISLDGFQEENDSIRGRGTFDKVMRNIDMLLDLQKEGIFKGEISVNCVINETMVGKLYDFAAMMEAKGVNTVYFCFPWFIPEAVAQNMDTYFGDKFGDIMPLEEGNVASWHSYTYKLEANMLDTLLTDIDNINEKKWDIRVRFQPALEAHEIAGFLHGDEMPGMNKSKCAGLFTRMNVKPDGKVTACKMFPEFDVGNLNDTDMKEVWNGENFKKVREVLNDGLTPVCSKCILLYLHGVS